MDYKINSYHISLICIRVIHLDIHNKQYDYMRIDCNWSGVNIDKDMVVKKKLKVTYIDSGGIRCKIIMGDWFTLEHDLRLYSIWDAIRIELVLDADKVEDLTIVT